MATDFGAKDGRLASAPPIGPTGTKSRIRGSELLDLGKGAGEWRRYASAEGQSPSPDPLAAAMALVGLPTLGGAGMELIGWMDAYHETP